MDSVTSGSGVGGAPRRARAAPPSRPFKQTVMARMRPQLTTKSIIPIKLTFQSAPAVKPRPSPLPDTFESFAIGNTALPSANWHMELAC